MNLIDQKLLTGYYSSKFENIENEDNKLKVSILSYANNVKSIQRLITCTGGDNLTIHTFSMELFADIKKSEIKNVCIKISRYNNDPITLSDNEYGSIEKGDSTVLYFQHHEKKLSLSKQEIKNYTPKNVYGGGNLALPVALKPHLRDLSVVIESATTVATYVIPILLFTKQSLCKGKPGYPYINDPAQREKLFEYLENQKITYTKVSKINANGAIEAIEPTEAEIASISKIPVVEVSMDLIEPEFGFIPRIPIVDLPPLNIPVYGNMNRSGTSQKRKLAISSTEYDRCTKQKRLG